jgi:DNA-directed RNA polymerase specialized sigma24 family protein
MTMQLSTQTIMLRRQLSEFRSNETLGGSRQKGAWQAGAQVDPRKAQIVELRFFGGLEISETAAFLNISEATVMRDWRMAKAWLHKELGRGE